MAEDPRVEAAAKAANETFNRIFPGTRMDRETALEVARTAIAAADDAAWMPIKEAPKDGTEVLVETPLDGVVSSHFKYGCWQKLTVVFDHGKGGNDPTRFAPLPFPPQEDTE